MSSSFLDAPEDLLATALTPVLQADIPLSYFEFWPGWLFYLPVVLYWIALGLRYGDLSLPTAANPWITAGGLCGESKTSILDQMVGNARDWVAPYVRLRAGLDRQTTVSAALAGAAQIGFPLVAKPDIGCNGTGVRSIADADALACYVEAFPPAADLVLQALVPYEGEAGIFYMRHPDEPHGRITSITLKHAPQVIGDGHSTLRQLIVDDPRLGRMTRLFFPRLADRLDQVPDADEAVRLAFVGNHCKGSTFRDGRAYVTAALTARVETIARSLPDFHFGRFDLRFRSLAELRLGTGFRIIEINGVGSEATHIWDPRTRLTDAYATQFAHYRAAFMIGRRNRSLGHRSSGIVTLFRHWLTQRRLMAAYPLHD